ncbi:MAG TPA: hypothetical protein DCP25_15000 [Chloroflexi bacterium]|jgi:hypothetical protein|nr:hypothetical protein [Chloroflexota bacterium]
MIGTLDLLLASGWFDLAIAWGWQLFILAVALLLALTKRGRELSKRVFDRLTKLRAGSFEIELGVDQAPQTRERVEEAFALGRARVRRDFDLRVHIHDLRSLRLTVIQQVQDLLVDQKVRQDFRSTIHVPDILFKDAMYQLLEYYPLGTGQGRAFPVRLGILGRSWRTGESEVVGTVTTDVRKLVREWGMTIEEAERFGRGRKSFVCAVVRSKGRPIGIFYLDSKEKDAFGEGEDSDLGTAILDCIDRGCADSGLTSALEDVQMEMRARGPAIRIFDEA